MAAAKPDNPLFSFVLDRFIERARTRGCANATVKMYTYFSEKFLKLQFGHRAVRSLETRHFEDFLHSMVDRGYNPSTVEKCRVTASGAMRHAQRQDWVDKNVVSLVEGPKRVARRATAPSPEEYAIFLQTAEQHDPSLAEFAHVLAATGIRPGEGCGLQVGDLVGNKLTIERSIDISSGGPVVRTTKTDRVRRLVIDEKTAGIVASRPAPWLFAGDTPWRPDSVAHRFRRISAISEVKITPIGLRHFHATQLFASNEINIKQVAERLGHADPSETLRTYAHVIPSLDARAAEVIEAVLRRCEEQLAAAMALPAEVAS